MTNLPIIRCRRCHRVLTDEESRKRGIGDVCLSKETSTQLELFEAKEQKEGVLPMEVFDELDEELPLANAIHHRSRTPFVGIIVSTPKRDETLMDLVHHGSPADILSEPEQDAFVEHLISQCVAELKRDTLYRSLPLNPRSASQ